MSTQAVVPCLEFIKSVGMGEAEDKNFVYSPVSIQLALSLVASGSTGKTLEQMLGFLNSKSLDDLNALSSRLIQLFNSNSEGGPILTYVGGLWVDKSLILHPSFKHVATTIYGAKTDAVDFQNKGEEVRAQVNKWAEKATNGLIESVLPPESITNKTKLLLTNALYFKGIWKEEFDESSTKESKFYLLDGSFVEAPFMTTYADQIVHSFTDFKGLRLPYKVTDDTKELSMYIFLPHKKDGIWDLVKKVESNSEFLAKHIYLSDGDDAGLHGTVMKMHHGTLIEKPIKVSKFHHRSFFEVNEEGTRATAVTVVLDDDMQYGLYDEPPPGVDFVADRPFMFMVRDEKSRTILFRGTRC
ncbi:hypothetical protein GIB67_007765 [Kingdonia uniflora]|uniref:Serpin domain-containing protein n=1 Tax=Kingdonia uniflora TaxID=39325 RepID=A0A7J7N240_9MAGN|nr:hypothetical protein GIB67_007765 [Kingdonia uniflora]